MCKIILLSSKRWLTEQILRIKKKTFTSNSYIATPLTVAKFQRKVHVHVFHDIIITPYDVTFGAYDKFTDF